MLKLSGKSFSGALRALRQHSVSVVSSAFGSCSRFFCFSLFAVYSRLHPFMLAGLVVTSLSGCFSTGAEHRPIVDGGDLANYETDLVECQQLALQRDPNDDETKTSALIGAVIGTLVGLGEGAEEAVAGAAVGALVGAGEQAYSTSKERKHIVINCMRGRGYNVVESTH